MNDIRWPFSAHRPRRVSERDLQVLAFLIRDGALTTREMAKLAKASDGTASRCLNSLHERGYVTRKTHDEDLRMVQFDVTQRGRDLYQECLLPPQNNKGRRSA